MPVAPTADIEDDPFDLISSKHRMRVTQGGTALRECSLEHHYASLWSPDAGQIAHSYAPAIVEYLLSWHRYQRGWNGLSEQSTVMNLNLVNCQL